MISQLMKDGIDDTLLTQTIQMTSSNNLDWNSLYSTHFPRQWPLNLHPICIRDVVTKPSEIW